MRGSERFTQRASTAITKAHDAALGMGHSYVGTEHLLLGIIREGEGLGARILTDNALTDAVLTRMVTETVGRGVPGAPEQGLSPRARQRARSTRRTSSSPRSDATSCRSSARRRSRSTASISKRTRRSSGAFSPCASPSPRPSRAC